MSRARTRSLIMAVHLRSSYFGPRIRSMDGAWGAAAATGEGDSDRRIRACDARRLVSPGTRGPHYDLIVRRVTPQALEGAELPVSLRAVAELQLGAEPLESPRRGSPQASPARCTLGRW